MKLLKELIDLYEMTTLGPKDHEFGIDIKLHVLQPGDKELPHGPRVKCIKKGSDSDFSIKLDEDPAKMERIGEYKNLLSTKEYNALFSLVQKYRIPFLNLWYNPTMAVDELKEQMARIDAGEEVVLEKP